MPVDEDACFDVSDFSVLLLETIDPGAVITAHINIANNSIWFIYIILS
jgi:hypothetical protein